MNDVIRGENVTEAWKKSINHLLQKNGHQEYNLIVEVENPTRDDIETRKRFNELLIRMDYQSVETVSNTIFPYGMWKKSDNRSNFYERFIKVYPILRKISANSKGTYFGRLVQWSYGTDKCFNQIENSINKLEREKNNGRGIRVMYEMSIYDPALDNNNQMGFPCMSFMSIKVRNGFVDLTAIYRNQFFVQKAYGNFLGLGRLLEFIANESGYNVGKLTCIATHADLEPLRPKANFIKMVEICTNQEQAELELDS